MAQHRHQSDTISLTLRLTPHGHLIADTGDGGPLVEAFVRGAGYGLLRLGAGTTRGLSPDLAWWRNFSRRAISALCHQASTNVSPPEAELAALVPTVPMMKGAEYVTADVLSRLWQEIVAAVAKEAGPDLPGFLSALNPAWNTIGRVHFNLAENRGDLDFPFAFMASYTTELAASGQARHVPLGQALHDYAEDHSRLLNLLLPVSRASQSCPWLKEMVEGGEIYHPLRWKPANAARFLDSAPDLGAAGIVLRMPASWAAARPTRPKVTASIGSETPSAVGLEGLLDFRMEVTLNGETLSDEEMSTLLSSTDSLVLLRGQWVEIDRDRLEREMQRFKTAEELAASDGLSFSEAMRLMSGAAIAGDDVDEATRQWSQITAGPWLAETLKNLRDPSGHGCPRVKLKARLRPYQEAGVHWLHLLTGLGLGACLADDMGLGKTVQVLALLLAHQGKGPSLLVAPASLLANWVAEIDRFAPDLRAQIVHPSSMSKEQMTNLFDFNEIDLVITSYGTLLRQPVFTTTDWKFLVLDEAQAIKNPKAKQTKAVKTIKATSRIALTGTPVENHLGDLWSIFDVINPGLLGSDKQFSRYAKTLAAREHNAFGPLRALVQPYILRRMKTDPSVISDLPDKTEVKAHCMLSRKQAALYAQTVEQLADALSAASGIERKGLVLATIMRLKQICNHPSQWLMDGGWDEADSGKWLRLREIAEVVAARQDKMLVFTQFRAVTAPLHDYLAEIFGRPGLVLHGNTPVKARGALVKAFQEDENVPFFILSLKAGGSGLTLTAASHVVHFDRWWNPAVENQATDRAFRIGQKRNVLVHKFVCAGTVEEKIDAMIEAKKFLSEEVLGGSAEINLTEMNDDDLLRLVALDLAAVSKE
ncbi:DEAD/DEAH box helicase [Paracoccaceae bacterium Fryx2]|nr:DEAD/DEAH box helicase [Paracoccaceae bacterium Fryx2]